MSNQLLQVNNLGLCIAEKTILKNINFKIHNNEIITLIGPNGAGKSSLVKTLLGINQPTSGKIIKKPNLTVGYVPQSFQVDQRIPINVSQFLLLNKKSVDRKRLSAIATQVDITSLLNQSLQSLSGGQLQRVLLARAIMGQPQLLILDEPAQGIDFQGEAQLYQLITQIKQQLQCGILMISHDLHVVMANTDQVLCLNQHICCSGTPESICLHPEFINLFGKNTAQNTDFNHPYFDVTYNCDKPATGLSS